VEEIMRSLKLSRRTLLRGSLGGICVSVALPALEAMLDSHGTAHADGSPLPRRLGIFFWGNGVKLDRWVPSGTGEGYELSPALQPLLAFKSKFSVVSGLDLKTGNERGHHAGCVGILSGAPMISQPHPNSNYASTFSQPSIDQVAAAAIGQGTRFRSLELGISTRVVKSEGTTLNYLSHNGPDNPNPPEYDPGKLFDRLFGPDFMQPMASQAVQVSRRLRKSVLDAVAEDLTGLQTRVGLNDRRRLDQHLANVRAIEKRLAGDVGSSSLGVCSAPVRPAPIVDQNGQEKLAERMKAMSDLTALALACDQTRVFSVLFTGSVGSTVFWQIGTDVGHHSLSHDEPGDQPLIHKSTVFTMEQFAILLGALNAVTEGDGTLLDHCGILASSDVAEGREHSIEDYPILVAGRAGGALRSGLHYRGDGGNTSQVLLTLLRSVGLPLSEFGDAGGRVSQGCSAIEAG
jgi:hypothetical protein